MLTISKTIQNYLTFVNYFLKRSALVNSKWQDYRPIFSPCFCWFVFSTVIIFVLQKIFKYICSCIYLKNVLTEAQSLHKCLLTAPSLQHTAVSSLGIHSSTFQALPPPDESVSSEPGHCFLLGSKSPLLCINYHARELHGLAAPPFPHLQPEEVMPASPPTPRTQHPTNTNSPHRLVWCHFPAKEVAEGSLTTPGVPSGLAPRGHMQVGAEGSWQGERSSSRSLWPTWDMPLIF